MESLACISALQRQTFSQRLELEDAHFGYEESEKESKFNYTNNWSREREKALRDTQFLSIYEMEELRRVQELRVDEFSRHELRESQAAIQKLTSQIQELQDGVRLMNDSGEIQE